MQVVQAHRSPFAQAGVLGPLFGCLVGEVVGPLTGCRAGGCTRSTVSVSLVYRSSTSIVCLWHRWMRTHGPHFGCHIGRRAWSAVHLLFRWMGYLNLVQVDVQCLSFVSVVDLGVLGLFLVFCAHEYTTFTNRLSWRLVHKRVAHTRSSVCLVMFCFCFVFVCFCFCFLCFVFVFCVEEYIRSTICLLWRWVYNIYYSSFVQVSI